MVAIFALVFFGILAGVVLLIATGIYNGLVGIQKQVEKSWLPIEDVIKQRLDAIPQLVQVSQSYLSHEKVILEKINEAKTRYTNAKLLSEKITASNEMTYALQGVLAIGRAYPELRTSKQFVEIQERLAVLADQLAEHTEFFNDSVTTYNTRIEQFPDMFFAQAMGYSSLNLFKLNEEDRALPLVEIRTAA